MSGRDDLALERCLEWRPLDWAPAARAAIESARDLLVPGASLLEVGFQTGMMALHFANRFGVRVTGYDADPAAVGKANANAVRHGLSGSVEFNHCRPEETTRIAGSFDVVFMKSVLVFARDPATYRSWLEWVRSVLRPGGAFIALENGRGEVLTRLYRRHVLKARYVDQCPFDCRRLEDFRKVFDRVDAWHFGRWSQFVGWSRPLHGAVVALENRLFPPTPDVNFVTAIVARRNGR
jgi:cyclopropane fatty-acyl-phospholipid synthase-like methyltransferase